MLSSLRLALLLVFVAFPLLEIALLIKAGETIGFWPTMTLLIAAAALGFMVIREQGLSMVGRMFAALNEGRFPLEPLLDSYVLIMAGILLIVPGLISDAVGLALLVAPLRKVGIQWAVSALVGGPQAMKTGGTPKAARTIVIEGTYERLDEDKGTPEKKR
jgi:UPF0716 protein FxsA